MWSIKDDIMKRMTDTDWKSTKMKADTCNSLNLVNKAGDKIVYGTYLLKYMYISWSQAKFTDYLVYMYVSRTAD